GFTSAQYFSDYFVENASFLRMQNATIGYNFGELLKKGTNLGLSFAVQNVFVITKYKGIDPEIVSVPASSSTGVAQPTVGVDQTIYPRPRTFTVLARLYATYAVSGQTGPAGAPDISGIDEGFSNYIRVYWQLQEVTTDEAVLGWNDGNLPAINTMTWNADNEFVRGAYDRIYYQIGLCNEFIRQTSDANLASRGITGTTATTVKQYRSEARLLRAMSYWHIVDLFGGGPFATEADALGTLAQYKSRADIFAYVESELKALDATDTNNGGLLAPKGVYARADQAVCWTLLAKLYLNAQVYTGTARYNDAVTYANKVLAANYQLCTTPSAQYSAYQKLFLADNNTTEARNE
nr:hypothetical protein [Tanacetum cinerariifolium]